MDKNVVKKVIQFGYGANGKRVAKFLDRAPFFELIEIWDNDEYKHGIYHENKYLITSPKYYDGIPIIISVQQSKEIKEELIIKYGFPAEAILNHDYATRYVKDKIMEAYDENDIIEKRKFFDLSKVYKPVPEDSHIVIYTAIFGAYDKLKQPPVQDISCEFICFTDNKRLLKNPGIWRVIYVKSNSMHPRMQAKYFKIMNHMVFPEGNISSQYGYVNANFYDYTIWIDGSISIKSPTFARDICSFLTNNWAIFKHPDRNCIFDEVNASIPLKKYEGQPLVEQASFYRAEGHPAHYGLWSCGVIVRLGHPSRELIRFCEAWWNENIRWSYQDQISFPYLLRKHEMTVNTIQKNMWENEWFDWMEHESCG